MAKGKPYSDAEIRPETPEILRYLEKQHYDSPDWKSDAVPMKQRGLGIRSVDNDASVYQIDTVPTSDKEKI